MFMALDLFPYSIGYLYLYSFGLTTILKTNDWGCLFFFFVVVVVNAGFLRGGCYKHTFYGITSYQCMETTPSLACANKCVFCWRHHKNPVGREWRWVVDDPQMIIEQAMDNHKQMIRTMKGVPGVQMDRWNDAFTIRHCALSLVGEPIIYPHINEFVRLLHENQISSFLVCESSLIVKFL